VKTLKDSIDQILEILKQRKSDFVVLRQKNGKWDAYDNKGKSLDLLFTSETTYEQMVLLKQALKLDPFMKRVEIRLY
jgi:hypothetical protein